MSDDWEDEYDEAAEKLVRAKMRQKKPRSKKKTVGPATPATGGEQGTVVTIRKQRCKVALGDELVTAWLTSEMAARQQEALAVGDQVIVHRKERDFILTEVLERSTTLSRPDPHSPGKERVVAANIDVVVQVSAAKDPPLRTGLIDRYLVAIERGGARPVICINKIDQADEGERAHVHDLLADYREVGIETVYCSAETGEGIEELRRAVSGKTAVLVGHSGVGKSSLLKALDEELQIATGALHRQGQGRHTTTSSTLYDFPDGTRLIDTPGIRELGLFSFDLENLRFYFPEFSELDAGCRYRGCTHLHEPECAVRDAAERGELPRYERYVRMTEEM